jgi:hypothetical protein
MWWFRLLYFLYRLRRFFFCRHLLLNLSSNWFLLFLSHFLYVYLRIRIYFLVIFILIIYLVYLCLLIWIFLLDLLWDVFQWFGFKLIRFTFLSVLWYSLFQLLFYVWKLFLFKLIKQVLRMTLYFIRICLLLNCNYLLREKLLYLSLRRQIKTVLTLLNQILSAHELATLILLMMTNTNLIIVELFNSRLWAIITHLLIAIIWLFLLAYRFILLNL